MSKMQTAERVSQTDPSDNYVFQRSLLAYHKAAELVSGNVLEIGTGSGYGAHVIAPRCDSFTTIDKHQGASDIVAEIENAGYMEMTVPPLAGIESQKYDYVVTFQVIEHIKEDKVLLDEITRVLKPGGRLIVSTPNRLMSLTRNPWHVREYTPDEFGHLLSSYFDKVEAYGVFGNQKVMEYYKLNKKSVERIMRFDILDLQHRLPAWLLRIPYDIANRLNRRRLLKGNRELTDSIKMDDYRIDHADNECFDLFYVAEKSRAI